MGKQELSALAIQAGDDDPLRALAAVAELSCFLTCGSTAACW